MNPYRMVHKGLRRDLALLLADVGTLAITDASAVAAVVERWRNLRVILDAHHRHEDLYIGPKLEQAMPRLFDEMESDHDRLHQDIVSLSLRADEIDVIRESEPASEVDELYLALADFTGRYLIHMGREETFYLSALHDAYTLDEVAGIDTDIIGNLTPELLGAFMTAVLPSVSPSERQQLERMGSEVARG